MTFYCSKRAPQLTEAQKALANKSHTQTVRLEERKRQNLYTVKVEAARRIQRAWRRWGLSAVYYFLLLYFYQVI